MIEMAMKSLKKLCNDKDGNKVTISEIKKATKELKKKKAGDRSRMRNEMIIEGGEKIIESIHKMFNIIIRSQTIPEKWKQMTIKSIYKGKGSKQDMKNRRGLFLTNIVSKLFERVISNRNDTELMKSISSFQCGGIKGRSTIDHLMTLMAVLERNKYLKKESYLIFGDAEKCFDKLWLKDGIIELWKAGTNIVDCHTIYLMNEEAIAEIDTPFGKTENIKLADIVRQGTIYGPKICNITTDKINKIAEKPITIYGPNLMIESLIYMDDVVGVGNKTTIERIVRNMREMEVQKKFTFNVDKSKYMIVPPSCKYTKSKNVDVKLEVKKGMINKVNEYKYLGTWLNHKLDYSSQLEKIKE